MKGNLILGDAIEIMRSMPDECCHVICTDPPYKVISGGTNTSGIPDGRPTGILKKNDGKIFEHNDVAISDYMPEFFRLLKPGSHCYVMTNNLNLRELLNVAAEVGFGFHNLLVWRKNNVTPNRWYMKEMELTCFFYKKPAKMINNPSSKQIFECNNIRDKLHPTQKPIELIEHYIINSTNVGDLVLDPFMGSGTTPLAADLSGRQYIGIEKDPDYFTIASWRLQEVKPQSLENYIG